MAAFLAPLLPWLTGSGAAAGTSAAMWGPITSLLTQAAVFTGASAGLNWALSPKEGSPSSDPMRQGQMDALTAMSSKIDDIYRSAREEQKVKGEQALVQAVMATSQLPSPEYMKNLESAILQSSVEAMSHYKRAAQFVGRFGSLNRNFDSTLEGMHAVGKGKPMTMLPPQMFMPTDDEALSAAAAIGGVDWSPEAVQAAEGPANV